MTSKIIVSKASVLDGGGDAFLDWQLADELASSAERTVCDAFTSLARGSGLRPSDIQMKVARSLRKAATTRLKSALAHFEKPKAAGA
ncbi:MAG: hypothetical protein JWQ07_2402 [Ramlibacter sp.]|nr:hypothetical protein [Ramlibacter sp.]